MSVLIDSVSFFENVQHGLVVATVPHTVSGADRVIYAKITYDTNSLNTIAGVTYGGVPLSFIARTAAVGRTSWLYRLINPPEGTDDMVVTRSTTVGGTSITVFSVTGADQTAPETGFGIDAASSGSPSIAGVPSSDNDLVLGLGYQNNQDIENVSEGAGQTLVDSQGNAGVQWISSKAGTSPTQSMSWVFTTDNQPYGAIVVSIAEATNGPSIGALLVTVATTPVTNVQAGLPYDNGRLAVDTVSAISHVSNGLNYAENQRICASLGAAVDYVANGLPFTSAGRLALSTAGTTYYSIGLPFTADGQLSVDTA